MWSKLDYILLNANPINHFIMHQAHTQTMILFIQFIFTIVTVQHFCTAILFLNFIFCSYVIIISLAYIFNQACKLILFDDSRTPATKTSKTIRSLSLALSLSLSLPPSHFLLGFDPNCFILFLFLALLALGWLYFFLVNQKFLCLREHNRHFSHLFSESLCCQTIVSFVCLHQYGIHI